MIGSRLLFGRRRLFSTAAAFTNKAVLPTQARVVIVGGGIIGNSIAYHLAHMGMKDVVLLEQQQLTSGTTWHAAGLMVTFGSLSETSTELRKYTRDLYSRLEKETGQATGFMPVGFIELASNEDRLEEYRRIASFNRKCGVDVREIRPEEVKERFPACRIDDILAGFFVEGDGRVNPVDATMALAKGARMQGAKIFEGVAVSGVTTRSSANRMDRAVTGVTLQDGSHIAAEYVVNCAGMWARQLGEASGVVIPNQAAEHYYLLTDALPEVDPKWPVIEDPSSYTYIRPEGGGLMVGLFEGEAAAWNVGKIPDAFSFDEIEPDWERMAPYLEKAMSRVPLSLTVGVKKFFCGPESFTPDLGPCLGESPEVQNYFVAAGLNSIGILTGGGVGRAMAHWIMHGRPDIDVTAMNVNRFHRYQANPEYRASRVVETLGMVYKCHYPYKSKMTARGAKRSPFYTALQARGAYFKDVSGWEGADWYAASPAEAVLETHSFQQAGLPFFPLWKAEHEAARSGCVAMDMSFMSKFLVQGRDAGECLNRLSTANVDGAVGVISYTQWLDSEGKMQADVTITKTAEDRFMVIATDTMHRHAETWMRRHLDPQGDKHVALSDITGSIAQLNIQGPRSRELMSLLTDTDMSDAAFPFRACRELAVGFSRVLCARITYVGELGYELHIPAEHAMHVYERVCAAGQSVGLVHAGLKALASMRMEKAYRDYGHDMDNTDTLLEVGLGFTADYDKPGGFIGKEATVRQRAEVKQRGGLPQRLAQLLIVGHPKVMMYHGEVLFRDGACVGDVRAASYGHSLGGAVGLAHITAPAGGVVNKSFLSTGKWEVEVAGARYPCKLSLEPMYDPKNLKIKA